MPDDSQHLPAHSSDDDESEVYKPQEPGTLFAGWAGPLPPPAMLKQFADIVPDGAERIYRQFELEAEHRRDQEKRDLTFKVTSTHIGQALAAAFVAGVLLLIFLIAKDSPSVATVLAGGTIVSGIVAFLRVRGSS